MLKTDLQCNAQCWELEIVCKNKKYLDAIVKSLLKYGMINFEVKSIEGMFDTNSEWDGSYTVFMWCSWFNNLANLAKDLKKIEKRFEV